MNMLRLPIFAMLSVCLSPTGCDSDNEEVTATASESGGVSSTGDMATSGGSSEGSTSSAGSTSGTTGDSATTAGSTETTGEAETGESESSETGVLGSCSDATGESSCLDTPQCQWFASSTVAPEVANGCEELGLDEGVCLEVDRNNRECSPNFLTTCEAGSVYYREAGLEIGAIELLVFNDESLCEIPNDFAPCQVNSEPKPGSEPSFFPPACACACE